jgi:site-specific DNA-cytosine methylase
VAENVPGLFSTDDGRFFRAILRDLSEMGYSVGWCTFGAVNVGALHKRDRVFIVAHSNNSGSGTPRNGTDGEGQETNEGRKGLTQYRVVGCSQEVSNSDEQGLQGHGGLLECEGQWTSWQGSEPLKDIWQSEPNVGRVAHGVPPKLDKYLDMIDSRKCAKQTTIAIIENNNEIFVGSNWCENPQLQCPRKGMETGEGYELCRDICRQKNHAEVDACIKAGGKARGSKLYLIGHYYFCENCLNTMSKYGVTEKYICVTRRVERLKGLGNAVVPQQIYEIYRAIVNATQARRST